MEIIEKIIGGCAALIHPTTNNMLTPRCRVDKRSASTVFLNVRNTQVKQVNAHSYGYDFRSRATPTDTNPASVPTILVRYAG